ncbi:MAG: hypothetical protein HY825_13685 [Acidobacteria bacterium]|nr:hypothetical protein [Acidobacteriota bacterium]
MSQPYNLQLLHDPNMKGEPAGEVTVEARLRLKLIEAGTVETVSGVGFLLRVTTTRSRLAEPLPEIVEAIEPGIVGKDMFLAASGYFVATDTGRLMRATRATGAQLSGGLIGPMLGGRGEGADAGELLTWVRRGLADGTITKANLETFASHPRAAAELRHAVLDNVTSRLNGLGAIDRTRYQTSEKILEAFAPVRAEIVAGGWPVFTEALRDRVASTAPGELLTLLDTINAGA